MKSDRTLSDLPTVAGTEACGACDQGPDPPRVAPVSGRAPPSRSPVSHPLPALREPRRLRGSPTPHSPVPQHSPRYWGSESLAEPLQTEEEGRQPSPARERWALTPRLRRNAHWRRPLPPKTHRPARRRKKRKKRLGTFRQHRKWKGGFRRVG